MIKIINLEADNLASIQLSYNRINALITMTLSSNKFRLDYVDLPYDFDYVTIYFLNLSTRNLIMH